MKAAARLQYEEAAGRILKNEVDKVEREDSTNRAIHRQSMQNINALKTHILILLHRLETLPRSRMSFMQRFHVSEACLIDMEKSKMCLYLLEKRETVNFAQLHAHIMKIQQMVRVQERYLVQCKQQTVEALGNSERGVTPRMCVCVLFCFVDPILGNRYGPGVNSFRHWPGVAGSSPFTLTTSLVIPVPSSSSVA